MTENGRENKIGVGLIGYGYWGPNLARNFAGSKTGELRRLCDLDPLRLGDAKHRYPGLRTTDDIDEILAAEDIDAVAIATPVATHHKLASAALKAGKHVFVEKPLAASGDEVRDLMRTAEHKGLTLMVGHTFIYSPPVQKVKQLIDSGQLGDIYYVSSARVNLGIHQSDVSVLWDLVPHDFSILFYWLDEWPIRLSATGKDYILTGNSDVVFVDLEFASGTIAHIEASWLSPAKKRQTTVVGSKKMVLYDDIKPEEQIKVYDKGVMFVQHPENFGEHQLTYRTGDINTPRLEPCEPLSRTVKEFLESISDSRAPLTDGANGLRVVEALAAAEKSMTLGGRPVELEWAARSGKGVQPLIPKMTRETGSTQMSA